MTSAGIAAAQRCVQPRLALFVRYPQLAVGLPYVSLGVFPTPVQRLPELSRSVNSGGIFVKRDDLSSTLYGGNKIRKLELELGRALREGVGEVLTFGYAGSNHATATAVMAHSLGLGSISMLLPQVNATYVCRNLLTSLAVGAELHELGTVSALSAATSYQLLRHGLRSGRLPQVIVAGGSSALGTVGFVAAAFELAEQVAAGELPEPVRIYVAAGSLGTAVGLHVGLRMAGLATRVIAVRVTEPRFVNQRRYLSLFRRTVELMRHTDPTVPAVVCGRTEVTIRDDQFGPGYAHVTAAAAAAIAEASKREGLALDGTYTAKAFAALLADAYSGELRDRPVLFWNTYNSRDVSQLIAGVDYRELPPRFHRYFREA